VNNAGIPYTIPVELLPLDELRRVFEVNCVGAVGVTQAFLPLLRRDQGRIVNVGSAAGFTTPPLYVS
jgi:NAD(P)-dependent dehydrogenase (short-subunit alcohol dehydrogenase family)